MCRLSSCPPVLFPEPLVHWELRRFNKVTILWPNQTEIMAAKGGRQLSVWLKDTGSLLPSVTNESINWLWHTETTGSKTKSGLKYPEKGKDDVCVCVLQCWEKRDQVHRDQEWQHRGKERRSSWVEQHSPWHSLGHTCFKNDGFFTVTTKSHQTTEENYS